MINQKGQVILILILVMTVALAIGISVIQRSLSDISTAGKVEQSSRAFSAAEAGIERAIQEASVNNYASISTTLNNNATVQVDKNTIPSTGNALEYPPLAREELAQVWLADPNTLAPAYQPQKFNLYFGTPGTTDKPAVEVTVVGLHGQDYVSTKSFFDSDVSRVGNNGFTQATCGSNIKVLTNNNVIGQESSFLCVATVENFPPNAILVRIRLLYISTSQPVAVGKFPLSASGVAFNFPAQARIFTATGTSGQTQRKVQVFRLDKVVPPFFDYAIFSAGDINK